jgi:hypothetical protein
LVLRQERCCGMKLLADPSLAAFDREPAAQCRPPQLARPAGVAAAESPGG